MDLSQLTPVEQWKLTHYPSEQDWRHLYLDLGAGVAQFTPWTLAFKEPTHEEFLQTRAAAEFCLLARRVLDILERRKWGVTYDREWGWMATDGTGFLRKKDEYRFPPGAGDPFTAVLNAEEWYKANVETSNPAPPSRES